MSSQRLNDKGVMPGILYMIVAFILYTASCMLIKYTSYQEFLSIPFFLCLIAIFLSMFLYAVLWQKVLELMALNVAFLCKSFTVVLLLFASCIFFDESVCVSNIAGTVLIMSGIFFLVWGK